MAGLLQNLLFGAGAQADKAQSGAASGGLLDGLPEAKHPVLSYLIGGQNGLDAARLRATQGAALEAAKQQRAQASAAAEQLFPGNKMMAFLALANPGKFTETVAESLKPQTVAAGSTVRSPTGDWTAPEKAARPQAFNMGEAGIAEYDPETRSVKSLYQPPMKAAAAPAGYAWNPDGVTQHYVVGGPNDPRVAGTRAAATRAPKAAPAASQLGGMSNQQLIDLARSMR